MGSVKGRLIGYVSIYTHFFFCVSCFFFHFVFYYHSISYYLNEKGSLSLSPTKEEMEQQIISQ